MKFTKASRNDKHLVTVSLPALQKEEITLIDEFDEHFNPTELVSGDEFILNIDGVRTLFKVNRVGKTATTKAFPRHLRLPSVGRPVQYEVFCFGQIIVGVF